MLGPLRVEGDDGTHVEVGGARLRVLLGMLALYAGSAVPDSALVDALWGAAPPVDVRNALQTLTARLRKAVRPVGMDSRLVRSPGAGYLLSLLPDDVDVHRFEALAKRGRRELAAGRFGEAAALLGEALALWRGPALLDMADTPTGRTWVARLTELRVDAMEDRFDAELHLGHHAEILPDLEAACVQHPLRERLASLRMQALHAAGRQSEALAAYDEIRTTLAGELGIDPSAELRATHIAGLRGELARPVAPRAANSSLPAQLTSFIGREDELRLVAKLLSEARLVTLVGPGGSGKSRLAVEAASRHAAHSRRHVWFVSLAVVQDPGDVRDVVLASLGLSDLRLPAKPPALTQPVDEFARFADMLGTEDPVLVLDNCEHVLSATAALAYEVLVRVPQLRILATSREPLAITGETLCPVDPLEVPGDQASADDVAAASAVRLFVDRARMARPNFALTESTIDYVVEICRRLDGMPLALELAAARLRAMSAGQIARRLDDRFKLLTSASATVLPPRHRTLHAVVEWSWDLLSETERTLACRLSVFPAGAMASTVEEVCSDDLLEPEGMVYVLSSLVDKSIVTAVSDDDGEPRYRMLETIRAFAAQRLAEAGETGVVTERFVCHFVRLAEETEPLLRTGDQLRALDVFDAEIDNMVAALRWALDNALAEPAYRLTLSLLWYWLPRGLHAQAVSFASEVRRFGNAIPDYALAALSAIQGPTADLDALPENQGLRVLIDDCERTDALSRVPALALALPIIAFISRDRELTDRELGRALAHTDPWVQASALWMQAFVLEDRGDLPGALRAREEALWRYQALGDRWGIAICLGSLAETCSLSGDHAGAIAAFERGHTLAIELGSTDDANNQKLRLAAEHMRSGDADRAQQCIVELDETAKATGNAWWEGMSILAAVDIARRRGDFAHAHAELARLAPVAASTLLFTDVMVREWIALNRAALAVSEGDHSGVRAALVDVVRGAVARRDLSNTARAAEVLTLLLMREGDPRSAATVLGLVCAIRGVFDRGNPELRELVDDITAEIGHRAYAETYRLSAELTKEDAIAALCETLAIPVEHAAVPPTRVWWGELWASRRMP